MYKETKYIKINYTDKDNDYIEDIINYISIEEDKILDFFNIKSIKNKVIVNIYNNIDLFRNNCKTITKRESPLWLSGLSYYKDNIYHIDTLTLEEYKKTKSHENATIDDLKKLIIHEFTHSIEYIYSNSTYLNKWLSEGCATYLSNQYNEKDLKLSVSYDDILNNKNIDYKNYYTMFYYCLNTYNKDYILKLFKDINLSEKESLKIYNETKERYH